MKRSISEDQEELCKKMKLTDNNDGQPSLTKKTLADLGQDELSVILPYLPIGSILIFSLVSKVYYDFVRDQVKNFYKYFDYDQGWALTDPLRQKRCLHLSDCSKIKDYVNELAHRNGSISEITKHILANNGSFQTFYDLLNVRKGGRGELGKLQVETICIDNTSEYIEIDEEFVFEKKTKTIEGEPVGYDLKNLTINMALTRSKFFKIMSKLKNLECLNLCIEQEYYRPIGGGRGKGGFGLHGYSGVDKTEDSKGEAFDEEFFYVPVMKNFKKLIIDNGFDNDSFIFEILPFCPNLEYLDFTCKESGGDEILNILSKYCTKIKYLKINTFDEGCELEITDEGLGNFLEEETQIEIVDLDTAAFISGAIFKRLGDFPSLKRFRAQRKCYEGELVDQEEDVLFGGNPNPNLEFLDIGPGFNFNKETFELFIHSLKKFAPNLKSFGELGEIFNGYERYVKIDTNDVLQFYLETIESLKLDLRSYTLIDCCKNLKKVEIGLDITSIEYKLLPNPNVIEIDGLKNGFEKFSEIFPNIRIIRNTNDDIVDFLCENKETWPHLVHLECYDLSAYSQDKLSEARPNLFIELHSKRYKYNRETPQAFYYKWLQRDILLE